MSRIEKHDMPLQDMDPYLQSWSEPESGLAFWWGQLERGKPEHLLVLPLYEESDNILTCLASLERSARFAGIRPLIILVVNNREKDPDSVRLDNQRTLKLLWNLISAPCLCPEPFRGFCGSLDWAELLVVDRSSKGHEFPEKQGVGLARKIGGDLACTLFRHGFTSAAYARTTDADALFPEDYFKDPGIHGGAGQAAAYIFPFVHRAPQGSCPEQKDAVDLYHRYLCDYTRGLREAGSPYAFATIGSAICFSLYHYALVRGFPARMAGEDFYFLNKLRKTGEIRELSSAPLILQGRLSSRVPFGTGQGIRQIMDCFRMGQPWKHYPDHAFIQLRYWLRALDCYCEHEDPERFFSDYNHLVANGSRRSQDILVHLKMEPFLRSLPRRAPRVSVRKQQMMVCFDAFRTMKFIHYVS
ncbi:MAG: hypothetical protein H6618_05005 [Deltaproteobacteria bacterium]|nr:hypothetical protein [Deltaproteobacteria bacterium]